MAQGGAQNRGGGSVRLRHRAWHRGVLGAGVVGVIGYSTPCQAAHSGF